MLFNNKNSNHALPTERLEINNTQLDCVNEFNFLGLTIDSDLNWNAHTQKIHCKISRTLGVLKKVKRIAPPSTLLTMYNTMILQNLNYGIKAWGFAHEKVFKIQKKAVRIITNSKFNAHTSPIFKNLRLLKVEDIFKFSCLTSFYKLERPEQHPSPAYFSSLITRNHDLHQYNTRNYNIRRIETNFSASRDSLRFYLPELINETPDSLLGKIYSSSIKTFKWHTKNYFIEKYETVCRIPQCLVCGTNRLL